jgi:hypothetical protein
MDEIILNLRIYHLLGDDLIKETGYIPIIPPKSYNKTEIDNEVALRAGRGGPAQERKVRGGRR